MTIQEQLRLAQIFDAEGNWAAAKTILLGLIQADKDNPSTVAVLIDGTARSRHHAEASTWIAQLDKLEPGSERVTNFRRRLAAAIARHLTAR